MVSQLVARMKTSLMYVIPCMRWRDRPSRSRHPQEERERTANSSMQIARQQQLRSLQRFCHCLASKSDVSQLNVDRKRGQLLMIKITSSLRTGSFAQRCCHNVFRVANKDLDLLYSCINSWGRENSMYPWRVHSRLYRIRFFQAIVYDT